MRQNEFDGGMRVVEYDRYGGPDVLRVRTREIPRPKAGQVLVRVHAAALNPKDVLVRAGRFKAITGFRFPRRVGFDWAGEIAEGEGEGRALFGMMNGWRGGACAEYAVVEHDELADKPVSLSWTDAAAIPLAGLTALQALRDQGRVHAGAHVLVNGASGGVGVYAVQIAKSLGARVIAVTSARNRELVRSLGADEALDYEVTDLRALRDLDVFFDVFGNRSFAFARPTLVADGIYISTVPKAHVIRDAILTTFAKKRARLARVRSRTADLEHLARMVEAGELRPVVDRVLPLEAVADAHRHIATKRARGKVVLSIDPTFEKP